MALNGIAFLLELKFTKVIILKHRKRIFQMLLQFAKWNLQRKIYDEKVSFFLCSVFLSLVTLPLFRMLLLGFVCYFQRRQFKRQWTTITGIKFSFTHIASTIAKAMKLLHINAYYFFHSCTRLKVSVFAYVTLERILYSPMPLESSGSRRERERFFKNIHTHTHYNNVQNKHWLVCLESTEHEMEM